MNIKRLLYESFDRNLSKSESKILDDAINKSNGLQKEKDEISYIREFIYNNSSKDFSPAFEFKAIQKLNLPVSKVNYQYIFFNSLNTAFKKLAYATLIFIILTLSYNFGKSGSISFKSALGIKQQNTSLADDFKNLFSLYD